MSISDGDLECDEMSTEIDDATDEGENSRLSSNADVVEALGLVDSGPKKRFLLVRAQG
jgi:hypothetical protein